MLPATHSHLSEDDRLVRRSFQRPAEQEGLVGAPVVVAALETLRIEPAEARIARGVAHNDTGTLAVYTAVECEGTPSIAARTVG